MAFPHYVYILTSRSGRPYVGMTTNLKRRLAAHNAGLSSHTAKYRPWRFRVSVAFPCLARAAAFERYLKSHSGRAFTAKHF
jgi:predicted GIY-YIG superfamily endonuclease